jgi:hypothetical protein
MNEARTHWDDVRRIAEELEPRIRLAGADARDRWYALQPRFAEIARMIAGSGEHTRVVVMRKLGVVSATLLRLRDDIACAHA